MRREDLRRLFARAKALSQETDFVVLGSLAVLGRAGRLPERMAASVDVDAYCKTDPERIFELAGALGQGSRFEAEHGYYLDPISPAVASLPAGWQDRLTCVELESELRAWFLDADDAAVSKYARMEPRDRAWIRSGLAAGIVSIETVRARFARTAFLDEEEKDRAHRGLAEDRAWLLARGKRRTSPK